MLNDLGIPDPVQWTKLSAEPLGEAIHSHLSSPRVLKTAETLARSDLHSRDPNLLGTVMCRLATIEFLHSL